MPETIEQVIDLAVQAVRDGFDFRRAWWAIEEALRKEPKLEIPRDSEQQRVFGISRAHVSMWLLERSLEFGASHAIAELAEFCQHPRKGCLPVIVLDQLFFASSDEVVKFHFSNDVTLSAKCDLDPYRLDDSQLFDLGIVLYPDVQPEDVPKDYFSSIRDVMRCLSLVRPQDEAVLPAYETEMWEIAVPRSYDRRQATFRTPRANLSSPLLDIEIRWAEEWLQKLCNLNTQHLDHVRRVLDLWMSATSSAETRDVAIDVRIILEALFVTDTGDNTHKVSRRGALMIGGSLAERLDNLNALKAAYGAGSRVVHGRRFRDIDHAATRTVRPLVKRCLQKWISSGAPNLSEKDWETIEMGAEYPSSIPLAATAPA